MHNKIIPLISGQLNSILDNGGMLWIRQLKVTLVQEKRFKNFGRFLSGMVMPNIGAFIAWGLITALFIPTGWTPNENLSTLVGPMITYLLPLLIGLQVVKWLQIYVVEYLEQ